MKFFSRHWPFVRGSPRSPVNSPHEGQCRGALMFSLICAWINGWVNNREAGDLRRYHAHYDVTKVVLNDTDTMWNVINKLSSKGRRPISLFCYWRVYFRTALTLWGCRQCVCRGIEVKVINCGLFTLKLHMLNCNCTSPNVPGLCCIGVQSRIYPELGDVINQHWPDSAPVLGCLGTCPYHKISRTKACICICFCCKPVETGKTHAISTQNLLHLLLAIFLRSHCVWLVMSYNMYRV